MAVTLEQSVQKQPIALQKLSSVTSTIWANYTINVKVLQILTTTSRDNRVYDLVLVSDYSGQRILYDCNELHLEKGRAYTMKIRASQNKRTSVVTCFITEANFLHSGESLSGKIDYSKRVASMVEPQVIATIERISMVSDQVESMGQPIDTESTIDLLLKNTSSYKYYYRIWADQTDIDRSQLEEGLIVRIKNVTVSKKEDSENISLTKNRFTEFLIEQTSLE